MKQGNFEHPLIVQRSYCAFPIIAFYSLRKPYVKTVLCWQKIEKLCCHRPLKDGHVVRPCSSQLKHAPFKIRLKMARDFSWQGTPRHRIETPQL